MLRVDLRPPTSGASSGGGPGAPDDVVDRFRHEQAVAAIDAANADDPTPSVARRVPPQRAAPRRADDALGAPAGPRPDRGPAAGGPGHHLRRWALHRSAYPEGRAGYLRWRKGVQPAPPGRAVAAILADLGTTRSVAQVQEIIRRQGRPGDRPAGAGARARCAWCSSRRSSALADRLGDDKTVEVVRRTIAKMSPRGRSEALELPWVTVSGRSWPARLG